MPKRRVVMVPPPDGGKAPLYRFERWEVYRRRGGWRVVDAIRADPFRARISTFTWVVLGRHPRPARAPRGAPGGGFGDRPGGSGGVREPRRPIPSGGADAIALPLPDSDG